MPVCVKLPSSTMPSQSLSIPSHTSGWGALVTLHCELAVLADDGPRLAGAQPVAAGLAHAGEHAARRRVVDLTVAVVVEAVADLLLNRDRGGAADSVGSGGVADQDPVPVAGTREAVVALGAHGAGGPGGVVDDSVAVVVEPVALLGRDGAAAGSAAGVDPAAPRPPCPLQLSSRQLQVSIAAVLGGAAVLSDHVVGVGGAVGVDDEAATVRVGVPWRAGAALVGDALVDEVVAVVVLAVTGLTRRNVLGDDPDQRRFDCRRVGQRDEDGLPCHRRPAIRSAAAFSLVVRPLSVRI